MRDATTNTQAPLVQAQSQYLQPAPGLVCSHEGQVVRLERILSLETAEAIYVVTGKSATIKLDQLTKLASAVDTVQQSSRAFGIDQSPDLNISVPQDQLDKIESMVKVLSAETSSISNARIKTLATALQISSTKLRQLVARYRQLGVFFFSFRRGRKKGHRYLGPTKEKLIDEAINEVYLEHRIVPVAAVMRSLEAKFEKARIGKIPAFNSINKRVQAIPPLYVATARQDKNQMRAARLIEGNFPAKNALSIVQMDFTVADLVIVDDDDRRPICRPLLGLAIDMASRVIVGAWLFLEAPSHATAGWMVAHSVLPKNELLRDLNLEEYPWPCYGKMEKIFVDGGFKINSFVDACLRQQINVGFRDPGETQTGGMIERAIGTFIGRLHMLHGTTYSNPIVRKNSHYDPGKAAIYTLREAMQFLVTEIYRYHHTPHKGLGDRYPIDVWEASLTHDGVFVPPQIPSDRKQFLIPFLWSYQRDVQREGIQYDTGWYRSEALRPRVGTKVSFWVNKNAPRCLYVEENGKFVEIPLIGRSKPMRSVWVSQWVRLHRNTSNHEAAHRNSRIKAQGYQEALCQTAAEQTARAHVMGAARRSETQTRVTHPNPSEADRPLKRLEVDRWED